VVNHNRPRALQNPASMSRVRGAGPPMRKVPPPKPQASGPLSAARGREDGRYRQAVRGTQFDTTSVPATTMRYMVSVGASIAKPVLIVPRMAPPEFLLVVTGQGPK